MADSTPSRATAPSSLTVTWVRLIDVARHGGVVAGAEDVQEGPQVRG
ncbi:hypothetical protein [Streptomyces sp. NPDC021969]